MRTAHRKQRNQQRKRVHGQRSDEEHRVSREDEKEALLSFHGTKDHDRYEAQAKKIQKNRRAEKLAEREFERGKARYALEVERVLIFFFVDGIHTRDAAASRKD